MHDLTRSRTLILLAAVLAALPCTLPAQAASGDVARWEETARRVRIVRDDWGIAHVYGKTDADAVFGMVYAQAEDDFNRVETNYVEALGRAAEAEGEGAVYRDLRAKMYADPDSLRAEYAASPAWLRKLMDSFADALNFYLYRHPGVEPRVIRHFEPWMALAFTEGSIGGDIEKIGVPALTAFYGGRSGIAAGSGDVAYREPRGSNGMAVAPSNTADHRALLLINPHTSFFFRSELQVVSEEGLDAYGAVTWGQFFVYQGFNDRVGWMHTSSGADDADEYLETIVRKGGRLYYRYGTELRPVVERRVVVPYRSPGGMKRRVFTVYWTQHGPVVRSDGDRWVTIRMMHEPVKALIQSYTRTKARSYAEFRRTMELHTNSTNNTIYADADGHIAYFHANFIPRRDPRFDWTKPVDGSDPATDWHGVLPVGGSPHLLDPPNGWLYNSNDWPWSAAGRYSPKRADFPAYVETGGPSWRGEHAVMVLRGRKDFTIERLRAAAYDSYLPAFAAMMPRLVAAYDSLPPGDTLRSRLAEQVALLRGWDYRWSVSSVPTSLAVFWGEDLARRVYPEALRAAVRVDDYMATRATAAERLASLASASDRLVADFGGWRVPWGEINRFQRITADIVPKFDDRAPSIPVGFTSARWGSLASFGARPYPNTRRWYGTSGNSFVAVVQFGDSVRAIAVTAGGESGHPGSAHFDDQAKRYSTGALREVYFYPSQLKGHVEREYHPGG